MPKPGPRTTYRYSDEFKATAVKLSRLPGVLVNDVAASPAIHPYMLSRWRKHAREGLIVTKGVQVEKDVAAELKEPRRVKNASRCGECQDVTVAISRRHECRFRFNEA
jgi:transposase